ncbi:MAG: hypothetical protein R6U98_05945 [Pirellulaceae bacterium]
MGAFVRENEVPEAVVRRALGVTDASESETRLGELGLAEAEIRRQVESAWAIYVEHGSKNWVKIRLKFALWFVEFAPGISDRKALLTGQRDGTRWVPAEVDVSIRPGWRHL